MTELDISWSRIMAADVLDFMSEIRYSKNLKSLNMSWISMHGEYADEICEILLVYLR